MRAQGYTVANVGNEEGGVPQTVVRHAPGLLEAARTVAAAVPGSVLEASDAIGETVQLVIGPGYENVVPVELGAPAAPETAAAESSAAAEPSATAPAPVSC